MTRIGTGDSNVFDDSGRRAGRHLFALLLATALAVTLLPAAEAQERDVAQAADGTGTGAVVLKSIAVESEGPRGPDQGIVARRSTTASKTDTAILETPQTVNVVTSDQMEAQAVDSVAEALRYTPGVLSEANGNDVRYDWLWIRGFNSFGYTWLDGLALPADPDNYATPSIHPYTLERVEVLKGPASVLYGRALPGGMVNEVSKRPQGTAQGEASLTTSAFGGVQGAADVTGPLTEDGEWLFRLIGLAKDMGTQIDKERDRKILFAPSLTWNPSTDTALTLYGYYQRDRDIFSPRFYPAYGTLLENPAGQIPRDVFMADTNADEFNRDYYAAGYEFSHRLDETWTLRQNLRYAHADQDMFLALVNPAFAFAGAPSNILNRVSAISDDSLTSFNVDNQAEANFDTGALAHTVLFGIDYLRAISETNFGNSAFGDPLPPALDYLNPSYGFAIPVPAFQRSSRQEQDQIGLYLQDQVRLGRWVATAGMRYDRSDIDTENRLTGAQVTTKDSKPTWRVGLTYLFENGLAPYASYTTSFLPTLGTDLQGDPFDARTARQIEVGVKYEPDFIKGLVTVSLFDLTMENGLTPDPANPRFSVQSGKERVRGLEVDAKLELIPGTELLAGYAYSDSRVLSSNNAAAEGREMLRLPKHQGSLWLTHRTDWVPGLSLNGGVRATSAYRTDSTYNDLLQIPGRALFDIGAEYDFGILGHQLQGVKAQVNVSNLFDRTYVSHCLNLTGGSCNYGAARTITASLKYVW